MSNELECDSAMVMNVESFGVDGAGHVKGGWGLSPPRRAAVSAATDGSSACAGAHPCSLHEVFNYLASPPQYAASIVRSMPGGVDSASECGPPTHHTSYSSLHSAAGAVRAS